MNEHRFGFGFHALLVALSLAVSACGSAGEGNVATVGSATLSEEDFEAILEANGVEDPSVVSSELAARHISEWIFFESWIDLASAGGTELSGVHLDLAQIEQQEARNLDPTVPADDTVVGRIALRYRAVPHLIADHVIAITDVIALCSSHLLVETELEAQLAIARFDAGEDFAVLAAEVSVGPSAASGGDLGCVEPATFVSEFVEGASAVGGAGVSTPVQSQFGWHVIQVRSFGPVVRGQHQELTSQEITSFVLDNYGSELQQLQSRLYDRDIFVDPSFGNFDADSGTVIPDIRAQTGSLDASQK